MDFTIIERAGLRQDQFGDLVGASRVTVNLWVNGKFKPRTTKRGKVAQVIKALETAVADGRLPIKDRREEELDAILKQIAENLQPVEA
jgi:transcriptional regulator with XRE-family HTH domain